MLVKVLPDNVVNKIAAGEVVDRPASVVRELVDNALDAGATEIAIFLEDGGRSKIVVRDNGRGLVRDDAILAFERHATSKLTKPEDLEGIATLGFRGEALPSIAAVSKVSFRTRSKDCEIANEISVEGGTLRDVQQVSGPVGTEVSVSRLFYSTPARRKFLKQPRTEMLRAKRWVSQAALARPDVVYRLYSDGREILHLPCRENSVGRAEDMFEGASVPVSFRMNEMEISGLIGHPSLAQGDTQSFVMIVNGRVVSNSMLLRAAREGFDSTLKPREYPIGFFAIDVPPEFVDVNVHPQKSEVRFRREREVFGLVRDGIFEAVQSFKSPVVAAMTERAASPVVAASPQPLQLRSQREAAISTTSPSETTSAELFKETTRSTSFFSNSSSIDAPLEKKEETFRFSNLRYLAQALECYLFCEYDENVYVVDMHAAHERYNFNLVRNGFKTKTVASQQLLVPITVRLTEEGVANCIRYEATFEAFGFQIEAFGEKDLLIRAAPTMLPSKGVESLIKEVSSVTLDGSEEGVFQEKIDHVAARIACHASIRSGKVMTRDEVYALFESLDRSEFSAACPHGRPVIVSFSEFDIERWFGRDR